MNGKSDTMGGDATESAALSHNDVAHSPAAAAPKVCAVSRHIFDA